MVKIIYLYERGQASLFKRSIIYVILSLFAYSFTLHAQTKVIGKVFDEKTKEPLTGATVVEKSTSNGVITDVDGVFNLQLSKGTRDTLRINLLGYKWCCSTKS